MWGSVRIGERRNLKIREVIDSLYSVSDEGVQILFSLFNDLDLVACLSNLLAILSVALRIWILVDFLPLVVIVLDELLATFIIIVAHSLFFVFSVSRHFALVPVFKAIMLGALGQAARLEVVLDAVRLQVLLGLQSMSSGAHGADLRNDRARVANATFE